VRRARQIVIIVFMAMHFFIPFWPLHGSVIMAGAFVGKRVGFLVGALVDEGAVVGAVVGGKVVAAWQAGGWGDRMDV
jgi:hypothetical protein